MAVAVRRSPLDRVPPTFPIPPSPRSLIVPPTDLPRRRQAAAAGRETAGVSQTRVAPSAGESGLWSSSSLSALVTVLAVKANVRRPTSYHSGSQSWHPRLGAKTEHASADPAESWRHAHNLSPPGLPRHKPGGRLLSDAFSGDGGRPVVRTSHGMFGDFQKWDESTPTRLGPAAPSTASLPAALCR